MIVENDKKQNVFIILIPHINSAVNTINEMEKIPLQLQVSCRSVIY